LSKTITDLKLSSAYIQAIHKLSQELKNKYPVVEMAIFGSAARGEAVEGSDLDLLVITSQKVTHKTMNDMY
jgi:predicted nucleotidyltransferase